ncbi:dynein heavy chain domain-containing protein 1 [Aquarana catesbeiana]|uniref:dynein heavy chain domain-containing protein 1 n=1 Tax=Aquarana catesbeiana TaxID=8400 RepID=UPI003CC9803C
MEDPTRSPGTRFPPLPRYITQPQPGDGDGGVLSPSGHSRCTALIPAEHLCCHLSELRSSSSHVSSADVSQVAAEVVHFISGSPLEFDRRWWLQLVDILKLLQPLREFLSDDRGILLPALERVHRQYEEHRSTLSDLDIPGALAAAFPLDHSTLFKLPKDLENLYQPQPPAVLLRDLPRYLASVGTKLATSESIWLHNPGSTSMALRTNLPVEVFPDIALRSLWQVPTHPFPPPSPPRQRLRRERSAKGVSADISGYTAAELLVQYRHLGKVVFLYLNKMNGIRDCHYDLHIVPPSQLHPEHFVFSPFGILHVDPLDGSETLELGVWHREAVVCRAVRTTPFFRDFLKRRAIKRWRMNVCQIRFLRKQEFISRNLVQAVPHYAASLQHVLRLLQELADIPWLPVSPSCTQSIQQMELTLSEFRCEAGNHLYRLLALVVKILELVREDTYTLLKTTQMDAQLAQSKHRPVKSSRGGHQQVESWLHRLGNFASLVGHMICQNLSSVIQQNILAFVNDVIQTPPVHELPFLQVSLEFGEAAELTLCPSEDQIQKSFTQALDSVLTSVLQVTELFLQNKVNQSSSAILLDAKEPDCPTLLALSEEQIRTVIHSPAPPPGTCRELPKDGELRIKGHLHRSHYLPLNLTSLSYLISSDPSIGQAREMLQRRLEESLAEVRMFCQEHEWVSEIRQYVQSWSPEILEQLQGGTAREYEDLILRLQRWEERVYGVRDSITTPVLSVSCSTIQVQTGPGLTSIIQDVFSLLTSEVAGRSQVLIEELSHVLEIFQGATTNVQCFSACAHKVAEYTQKKKELQERVEYVQSLREVIRMNFRQATAEEQIENSKLVDTWDSFQHHLKTSAEYLSGHLSSMSDSLEQSFLACYREAEGIIAVTSSPRFLDPEQNPALILTELGDLHHNLRTLLSQLRDFSHSHHILQDKALDISAISHGEQCIQARKESWKLLTRSQEQVRAWKLRPFTKVNTEQMREKLCRWERSLQDLAVLLSADDPIISSVRLILQDILQHLPLLQSLLSPALTPRHWAAIFTVMGSTFSSVEALTLKDLLSHLTPNGQEEMQKVVLRAQADFSLAMDLKTIQTFWKEKEFRLVRFLLCVPTQDPSPDRSKRPPSGRFREPQSGLCTQDSGTYLLSDTRSICSLIDDNLLSLQTMRASPFSTNLCDDISGWIQKLQDLALALDLWISFQRRWVFLTKIQCEMELQLPSLEMFLPIDQTFRSFLEVTRQDPLVLSILNPRRKRDHHFHGEALCSAFRTGISVMEDIIINMADVLYSYCYAFPRLFFLGDQDLVEILAASPEPSERLPCALLCFPHLTDVTFQSQSPNMSTFPLYSSQSLTVGVTGNFQEMLTFKSAIQWNPKTVSWLIQMEGRLKDSIRDQLELCLSEFRKERLEGAGQWVARGISYPWQCLAVTEEVLWCEGIEKVLLTDQKSSLKNQHRLKIQLLTDRLTSYTQVVTKLTLYREQAFFSAWIILAIQQRDRTLSLLNTEIQTLNSFSWSKQFKYRVSPKLCSEDLTHDNDDPEMSDSQTHPGSSSLQCYVDVCGYRLPYGYEYVGLDMSIAETPLSERTALGLIMGLHHYQCMALIGQDESSRMQTLMVLGNTLGRHVEVLKCWSGLTLKRLTQHLQGALQSGAWLVLSAVHQLKSSIQASLGQLLQEIQSSCQGLMAEGKSMDHPKVQGSIQLNGLTVPVNQGYGCFVTLPNINSSCPLPQNLRLLLRPVSFRPPELCSSAELAFLAAGFQGHFNLAHKIARFFQLAQECGAVSAGKASILMKTVIQRAISILKINNSYSSIENCREDRTSQGTTEETDYNLDPHFINSRNNTVRINLQEEKSIMIAISTLSLWSSLSVSQLSHLQNILKGIFPMYMPPFNVNKDTALWSAIAQNLQESGLEVHAELSNNIVQLFQALQHSSGVLLTGPPGGGKTTCWKVLHRALNLLAEHVDPLESDKALNVHNDDKHQPVHIVHLFPNSLSPTEFLGGERDEEQTNGIFSNILRRAERESLTQKWVILDGSATPGWIEPISCLFGPHPTLTLASGQRLHINNCIKLLFEMADMLTLSPAVSTACSVVHCGGEETWKVILRAFTSSLYVKYRISWSTQHLLQSLSDSLIPRTLCFLEQHCTSALYPHSVQSRNTACGVQEVSTFCTILQALMDQRLLRISAQTSETPDLLQKTPGIPNVNDDSQLTTEPTIGIAGDHFTESPPGFSHQDVTDSSHHCAQSYFLYAFIWGFGGHLHPKHRSEFDTFFRESLSDFAVQNKIPPDISVFEVTPSPDGTNLTPCPRTLLPQSESPLYAAQLLASSGHPLLLVGSPGSGKTTLVQSVIPHGSLSLRISFHPVLKAAHLRHLLTVKQEAPPPVGLKRARPHRVRNVFFLDDLHEAAADSEGHTHPALEVVRHVLSDPSSSPSCILLATASPPDYGFTPLPPRLSRLFSVLVLAPFGPEILLTLFTTRFTAWLKKSAPVQLPKGFGEALALASIHLYQEVIQALPPKYCFSLHHLHKVFQSMTFLCPSPGTHLSVQPAAGAPSPLQIRYGVVRLWMHEALRTFSDGLDTQMDKEKFKVLLQDCTVVAFCTQEPPENTADEGLALSSDIITETCPSVETKETRGVEVLMCEDQALEKTEDTKLFTITDVCTITSRVSSPLTQDKESLLPIELVLDDQHIEDLNFCHESPLGTIEKVDSLTYKERPLNTITTVQTKDLTLSPADQLHLSHLKRALLLPRGHLVLLSQHPSTGRKSLARLAAQNTRCTLLEISGKETAEEIHAVIREACWKAGVLGTATALLVDEGTPQTSLRELEVLIREGTFPGLYNKDEEEKLMQAVLQVEKNRNRPTGDKALQERFSSQVRDNLHVIFIQRGLNPSPWLARYTYTDIYQPWDFTSLYHVSEKLLQQQPGIWSSPVSLPKVMSLIHLSAQSYCQRMWPELPLTSPRTFISFINIFLKFFAHRRDTIMKEIERLQSAVCRVEEVYAERERWTKEAEILSQRQQDAELETERRRKELKETREGEHQVRAECEELERSKEHVRNQVNTLQGQRQLQLEEACVQWSEVQKQLKLSDVEEIRSYRAPPPPVIMVTDVLCTVFGKEPGWESAKLLLGQEEFYQDLQFYDGRGMSDAVFSALSRAVRGSEFSASCVRPASAAAASLCDWLRGLHQYCSVLRKLEKSRSLLSRAEAQDSEVAERIAERRLQQERLRVQLEQLSLQLKNSRREEEDLRRQVTLCQEKHRLAEKYEDRARAHESAWRSALETLQNCLPLVPAQSLLVAASISYLGSLPWPRCTALLEKWQRLCNGVEVPLDPDDVRDTLDRSGHNEGSLLLEVLSVPTERIGWFRRRLPVTLETQIRATLLRAGSRYADTLMLVIDPDYMAERWLSALLGTDETGSPETQAGQNQNLQVIDASEPGLSQKLDVLVRGGVPLLIANMEKNLSCVNSVQQLFHRIRNSPNSREASLITPPSPKLLSCPRPRGAVSTPEDEAPLPFQVFLSTSLPLREFVEEAGPAFIKEVTVMDLSLGSAGLKEELIHQILLLKDLRLQEERRSLYTNYLKLTGSMQQAKDTFLDYVTSDSAPLLQRTDFLHQVTACEERQSSLVESLNDIEVLQHRVADNIAQHTSAAEQCCNLYSRLQEISRLCPQYHFSARSVLCWAAWALRNKVEEGSTIEKILTTGILSHVLPALTEEHKKIFRVLLAVGQPPDLEWFSFLGLASKTAPEVSSSYIQRPQWLSPIAWEELQQLERMPCFQGIRSSLSTQTRQWQEYFRLCSTVIGPIPCSNFSHLTLFQMAILWRIVKPESLGLVLTNLVTCILGPDSAGQEEDIIAISDARSPVVFPIPGCSPLLYHPQDFILHKARSNGKEVKVVMCSSSLPDSEITNSLVRSQQEGVWVLMHWHPKLASVLEAAKEDPAQINPEFRMCIIVEEEKLGTVLAHLRRSWQATPCVFRPTICQLLPQSCTANAEEFGERLNDPRILRLLTLHSILLLRQEYGNYVQSDVYAWGYKELRLALHCAERMTSVSTDWADTMSYLTGDIIYGGHIVDEGDAQSVMVAVQQCLQDQPHLRLCPGLSSFLSTVAGGRMTGPGVYSIQRFLRNLSSQRNPAALGLNEGLHNIAMEVYGRKVLPDLLITQDIWTIQINKKDSQTDGQPMNDLAGIENTFRSSSSASSCSPKLEIIWENPLSQCLSQLMDLKGIQEARQREMDNLDVQNSIEEADCCNTHQRENKLEGENLTTDLMEETQARGNEQNKLLLAWRRPSPLLSFLREEWDLLSGLINQVIQELKDADSPCCCLQCQRIREAISESRVPTWWNIYSPTPPTVTPLSWISSLITRMKLLSSYVSEPSLHVTYNLSAFCHPAQILQRVLMQQALRDHQELDKYSLSIQVSDRRAPPVDSVCIALGGIHLKHALWDTRLCTLQETLSPKLCALPEIHITAVQGNGRATCQQNISGCYLCPVYLHQAPEGNSQHRQQPLLYIPLPTKMAPDVWSLRRVHALSLL